MDSKKYTCPRCGSEDDILITIPKKENPKKYIIGLCVSLSIMLITSPIFLVQLIRKVLTPSNASFWISLVVSVVLLIFSIFFLVKWLNSKNDDPIEECVCKKCGEIWLDVPPIHSVNEESNQND
ncbi:MAG: hypothetical protein IJ308_03565 [Clostridia bacterium]|nr:hypothetical protein [Clostridia bacterium]